MKQLIALLFLSIAPLPVNAGDLCDDLWFSRNQIFDAYGYCFASNLGKAVFDNAGCSTKTPNLSASDQAFVAWIALREQEWDCRVDSTRTRLNIDLLPLRRMLEDPVVLSGSESVCEVWSGDVIALRAGHADNSPVIGHIRPGKDIYWEYTWMDAPAGWDFLVARQFGDALAMGWSRAVIDPAHCEGLAG